MSKDLGILYAELAHGSKLTVEPADVIPAEHADLFRRHARRVTAYRTSGAYGYACKAADQGLSEMAQAMGVDRPDIVIVGTDVDL